MYRKKLPIPAIPFVEARCKGGRQKPTAIVLKSSYTTSEKGAALAIALNWNSQHSSYDATHYVVDEATTYRCVWDWVQAIPEMHETKNALTVNVCHDPGDEPDYWYLDTRLRTMHRTADLVAELMHHYRIPTQYLHGRGLDRWLHRRRRSRGGIILKIDGYWPAEEFLNLVRARRRLLAEKG